MIDHIQHELASMYVLGLLPEQDTLAFEAELTRNSALRAEIASLNNATLALARSAPNAGTPSGGREKLMATLGAVHIPPTGFHVIPNDDEGWLDTPVTGFRIKPLGVSRDLGYQTLMVEFAPGTHYPAHLHESTEQLIVFSGTVQTEGRILGPGDFIQAEPGSYHQELYSHSGCRALLVRRAA